MRNGRVVENTPLPGASAAGHTAGRKVPTVRSMDVALKAHPDPRTEPAELRLRVVARPDKPVAELLQHLGLQLPHAPKILPET